MKKLFQEQPEEFYTDGLEKLFSADGVVSNWRDTTWEGEVHFVLCLISISFVYVRQSSVDKLNNVRREASRHFRIKKKAYLKDKIEELEANSKINNIRDLCRGINERGTGLELV